MDIIKKLFTFNDEENLAIGLCKFNDTFNRQQITKQEVKKQLIERADLTLLKEGYIRYTKEDAKKHYAEHVGKDFYPNLELDK